MCGTSVPAQFESLHLPALIDLWPANWPLLRRISMTYCLLITKCNWDMKWLNHWRVLLHASWLTLPPSSLTCKILANKTVELWQYPHHQTDLIVSRCTLLRASPEAKFFFFAFADDGHNEWKSGHWLYALCRVAAAAVCLLSEEGSKKRFWLADFALARTSARQGITSGRLDRAVMYAK